MFLTPVAERIALEIRPPGDKGNEKKKGKSELLPLLLAICTSANIGSSATLTGNPQNVLIASKSGIDYISFLLIVAPASLVGIAINFLAMWLYVSRGLFGIENSSHGFLSNGQTDHEGGEEEAEERKHLGMGKARDYQSLTDGEGSDYQEWDDTREVEGEGKGQVGWLAKYYGYGVVSSLGVMMLLFLLYGGRDIGWITAVVALSVMALDAVLTNQVPNWVFPKVSSSLL